MQQIDYDKYKPLPGVMYGLTHNPDGSLNVREPKITKVGIGLPKGPAIDVHIAANGKWRVRTGFKEKDTKILEFDTKDKAQAYFRAQYDSAPICGYPRKIPYFTFSRKVIGGEGSEHFEPDWDCIEKYGPKPTIIDIIVMRDQPTDNCYAMWSASKLLCRGDGINALRDFSIAKPEEAQLVEIAKANGENYFPIIEGCWTMGCPYSKPTMEGNKERPSACKRNGAFRFQLAKHIRLGASAYFHTTSWKSIEQIHSLLEEVKVYTDGRLAGFPLKMTLEPYRAKHNGVASTQYAVNLEFRAEDADLMRQALIQKAWSLQNTTPPPPRRIAQALDTEGDDYSEPVLSAQDMTDEFYTDVEEGESEDQQAASASNARVAALRERLAIKEGEPCGSTATSAESSSQATK